MHILNERRMAERKFSTKKFVKFFLKITFVIKNTFKTFKFKKYTVIHVNTSKFSEHQKKKTRNKTEF